ncbi:MAG: hypothetical protein ACE5D2_00610 [Fidelibacterota bacterium]
MTDDLKKKKKLYNDLLEFAILFGFIFLVISIYVPRAIWDEEEFYENKSHFNLENIYNLESFYYQLMNGYTTNGLWAMKVVNSVRDSLTGDSTYVGEQRISLDNKNFSVAVPMGFDVDYDTTFGFPMTRRDTIVDTIATIVVYSEDLSRNDTMYVQKRRLTKLMSDSNFIALLEEVPSQRVEFVNYYDSYMPDSSMNYCPVTREPYIIKIKEGSSAVRVESPIKKPVVDKRYLVFAFEAENHGYIDDGTKSWDQ